MRVKKIATDPDRQRYGRTPPAHSSLVNLAAPFPVNVIFRALRPNVIWAACAPDAQRSGPATSATAARRFLCILDSIEKFNLVFLKQVSCQHNFSDTLQPVRETHYRIGRWTCKEKRQLATSGIGSIVTICKRYSAKNGETPRVASLFTLKSR